MRKWKPSHWRWKSWANRKLNEPQEKARIKDPLISTFRSPVKVLNWRLYCICRASGADPCRLYACSSRLWVHMSFIINTVCILSEPFLLLSWLNHCISYFLVTVIDYYARGHLEEKEFILPYSFRERESIMVGKPWGQEEEAGWPHFLHRQEADEENRKWGQAIKPQSLRIVTDFLQQGSTLSRSHYLPKQRY